VRASTAAAAAVEAEALSVYGVLGHRD